MEQYRVQVYIDLPLELWLPGQGTKMQEAGKNPQIVQGWLEINVPAPWLMYLSPGPGWTRGLDLVEASQTLNEEPKRAPFIHLLTSFSACRHSLNPTGQVSPVWFLEFSEVAMLAGEFWKVQPGIWGQPSWGRCHGPWDTLTGTTGPCFVLFRLKILWEAQMDIFFDYRSLTIGGPIKSIGKGNTTWPFGIWKCNRKIPLKSGTSHGFETSILILLILWRHITSPKCYGKNAFFKQKESYGIIYCETPLKYIQLSSL